jgi:hypothetical protein
MTNHINRCLIIEQSFFYVKIFQKLSNTTHGTFIDTIVLQSTNFLRGTSGTRDLAQIGQKISPRAFQRFVCSVRAFSNSTILNQSILG